MCLTDSLSSKQEEHPESDAGLSGPGPLPALPGALAHAESRSEAGRGTLEPPGYVSASLVMTVAQGEWITPRCFIQVKKRHRLWEACAAPWPPSPATSPWPAWSLTSVWPVLLQRSAAPAWRRRRALRLLSGWDQIAWWLAGTSLVPTVRFHLGCDFCFLSKIRGSRCDVHRQQFLISFVIHSLLSSRFLTCLPSALPHGCGFYWITILFSGKEHFNVQPLVWSTAVPERLLLFSPLNVLMQYIKSASSRSIETITNSYLLQTYIRCLYLFALKILCWK